MSAALMSLLYEAFRAKFGIVVNSNNPEKLRQKLYPLKKSDPDLANLSFPLSPTNPAEQLWIVKKNDEPADTETHPAPPEGGLGTPD